ncbi:MAG: hypothetical protein JXR56_00965, partial [Candidatus Cloacimonetes bacterium]|nr:hypothetical protein [Candidatus Cloacimonadota bacterium]
LMNNQMIYMRLTTATAVDVSYPGTAGFTLVYNQSITWNGGGWTLFELDTPFTWDGVQNIEIMWENRDGSWASGAPTFHYTSAYPNFVASYKAQDGSFPTSNGNFTYNRPNIMFNTATVMLPNPIADAFPYDGATYVETQADLTWNSGGGSPTGYRLYFGMTTTPPLIGDLGNVTTYTPPTAFTDNQMYYWQVIPYNATGDAENCPIYSFTTIPGGFLSIGTGTAVQRQPFGTSYGYERSATIYTSAQLGRPAGSLDQVGWYSSYGTTVDTPFKIYAKETTDIEFQYQPWDDFLADAVLLMEGTHSFDNQGWNMFVLDNTFSYTGTNLVLIIETDYGGTGTDSYPQFRYTPGTGFRHQYWYSDNQPPSQSGYPSSNIPNTLLHFEAPVTGPPAPPIRTFPEDGATGLPIGGFNLRWSPNGNGGYPDYYQVLIANAAGEIEYQQFFDNVLFTQFNPVVNGGMTFNYGEVWYWQVNALNNDGTAMSTPPWSFQIEPDLRVDLPYLQEVNEPLFPPDWSQSHCDGLPNNNWIVSQTNNAGGEPNEFMSIPVNGIGTSRLISPPFNTSNSDTWITFNHHYGDSGPGLTGKLQYSADCVVWYDTAWSFNSGMGNLTGEVQISITGFGSNVTYLAWTLDGPQYQFSSWSVDEIQVEAQLPAPEGVSISDGVLSWTAVPGAATYTVYSCSTPDGEFVYEDASADTNWTDPSFPQAIKFYKVTAQP